MREQRETKNPVGIHAARVGSSAVGTAGHRPPFKPATFRPSARTSKAHSLDGLSRPQLAMESSAFWIRVTLTE